MSFVFKKRVTALMLNATASYVTVTQVTEDIERMEFLMDESFFRERRNDWMRYAELYKRREPVTSFSPGVGFQ